MKIKSLSHIALASIVFSAPAFGAVYDAPVIGEVVAGFAKAKVAITTGDSGAPSGFAILWMTEADYHANNDEWYPDGTAPQRFCWFTGSPTLNTWEGALSDFRLPPNTTSWVEVGDLFDETGIATDWVYELTPDESYAVVAYALGDATNDPSPFSNVVFIQTAGNQDCTLTQGYWKNHPEVWPVDQLTLGTVLYTANELLQILGQPAQGNGLVFLAHQLIAVELNIESGADPSSVQASRDAAHALIGNLVIPPIGGGFISPAQASPLTQILDDYNNGIIGPGHCAVPTRVTSWSRLKSSYR